METEEKIQLIKRNTVEIVTEEESGICAKRSKCPLFIVDMNQTVLYIWVIW